ncbi:hypothetical protein N9291_01510, partial [bacterium]|nr:hypothetical protein [bacterium]
ANVDALQFAQSTFEIWLRPGAVTADHGFIFLCSSGGITVVIKFRTDSPREVIAEDGVEVEIGIDIKITGVISGSIVGNFLSKIGVVADLPVKFLGNLDGEVIPRF